MTSIEPLPATPSYGDVLVDDWWTLAERAEHPRDGSTVYRAGGAGPVRTLMLHGVGNSGGVFASVMPALAERGPVAAPTIPPSLLTAPDLGPTETMTPLVEWLAEVAPPPWRLVGHSMGGVLTGLILRSHPELVEAAVTLNSPLPGVVARIRDGDRADRTGRALLFMKLMARVTSLGRPRLPRPLRGAEIMVVRNALRGFVVHPGRLDDRVISRTIISSRTTDGHEFLSLATEMPEWEVEPFADRPVMIVLGGQDPLLPLEDRPLIETMYPEAEITVLDRCGHFAHLEQPERTVEGIVGFFDRLD